jgi:hypothetical protein
MHYVELGCKFAVAYSPFSVQRGNRQSNLLWFSMTRGFPNPNFPYNLGFFRAWFRQPQPPHIVRNRCNYIRQVSGSNPNSPVAVFQFLQATGIYHGYPISLLIQVQLMAIFTYYSTLYADPSGRAV